jgi:hypothetical protein
MLSETRPSETMGTNNEGEQWRMLRARRGRNKEEHRCTHEITYISDAPFPTKCE